MTTPITIAYLCPKCGAGQAILPPKIEAAGMVRCAQCGRQHGSLDEVQKEITSKAHEDSPQKMRRILPKPPHREEPLVLS